MTLDTPRLINLMPVKLEPSGDVPFVYESVPGLKTFAIFSGEARGGIETNDRVFVVFGSQLFEVMASGNYIARGTLNTTSGPVSFAYGLSQVVMVDGDYGYVLRMSTNAFQQITSDAFYGSPVVRFMDNYFLFVRPDTQQFYISAINDASSLDALDFASAESQPDNLVTLEVDHSEIYLFGQKTVEIWFDAGAQDFPFARSQGSSMEVGCMAAQTVKQIDNSIFWLGRDKNGSGIVYRAQGHQPQRISEHRVEEALQKCSDPSQASAYVYQDKGLTFYAINAPGMATTWVYEVAAGQWHERCDLDALGLYKAQRTTISLFAFNKHLAGATDGTLYQLDDQIYKNGSDPLVRELITARQADPDGRRMFFSEFVARLRTGGAKQGDDPQIELSWTDDAGKSWRDPILRSLGKVGQVFQRVLWSRLGQSRDRAWSLKFAGDAPFSIRSFKPKFTVSDG